MHNRISPKMESQWITRISPEDNDEKNTQQEVEETLIRDLKPIMVASRFIGLTPCWINKTSITFSKVQATLFGIGHTFVYYFLFSCLQTVYKDKNMKQKDRILSIAFEVITTLCVHINYIVCILQKKNLQAYLNNIMFYDKATKCGSERNNKFVTWSWTLIFGIIIVSLSIGGLTYEFELEKVNSAILYCVLSIFLALGIFKFLALVAILLIRFQHLNSIMMKDYSYDVNGSKRVKKIVQLHEAWELHGYLSKAAEKLCSVYSVQLLLWIVGMSFNGITQIYSCLTEEYISVNNQIREIIVLVFIFAILITITTVCHTTASEANKMGAIMFSSEYFRRDYMNQKEDSFAIGQYFLSHSFKFSCGFFNIDLPLLMTIFSAMTTYLVILMSTI